MNTTPDKYSLWLTPTGNAGTNLQELVTTLANENDAPDFVPHLTLVANIFATPAEVEALASPITQLARQIGELGLTATFTGYGFTDEEFRSLFLVADPTEQLDRAYEAACQTFPQVDQEHFRGMPHASVLYGRQSRATKERIIAKHPLAEPITTELTLGLYKTNNPIASWVLTREFPLNQ